MARPAKTSKSRTQFTTYGKKHSLTFIEGKEVVEYFEHEMDKLTSLAKSKVSLSTT